MATKKSITQLAAEVWQGKWGNGQARVTALTKAGYNASAVQAAVNKGVGKTTTSTKKTTSTAKKTTSTAKKTTSTAKKTTPTTTQQKTTVEPVVEEVTTPDISSNQSILQQFMDNYGSALQSQYQANVAQRNQDRANAQTSIMSNANVAGMSHSNLPARDKVKYDTNTYLPGLQQDYTTYQTGLSEMRAKAAQLANTLKGYEESTADQTYALQQYQKQIDEQLNRYQAQGANAALSNMANTNQLAQAVKDAKTLGNTMKSYYGIL